MNRYSTMTMEIEAEFALGEMADVWVTFSQGRVIVTKKKSLKELEAEGTVCRVKLSQSETAMFRAFSPIAVQVRWVAADGTADSSEIDYFSLEDVLQEGEIGV